MQRNNILLVTERKVSESLSNTIALEISHIASGTRTPLFSNKWKQSHSIVLLQEQKVVLNYLNNVANIFNYCYFTTIEDIKGTPGPVDKEDDAIALLERNEKKIYNGLREM